MDIRVASFAVALVFAGTYLVAGRLAATDTAERFWSRRRYLSAAAGISTAYIFVDVLPELELQRKVLIEAAAGADVLFAEQRIYVLALLSFVIMYGLEHMVLVARGRERNSLAEASYGVYALHLAGYAAYTALIGYLLVERAERGALALLAYAVAMAVHFFIVDHSLAEEHGKSYGPAGRWLLATSVLVGWLIGSLAPVSEVVIARLFAILAGGVVITSLRAELPDDRDGRFWPFCFGALIFAAFLLLT